MKHRDFVNISLPYEHWFVLSAEVNYTTVLCDFINFINLTQATSFLGFFLPLSLCGVITVTCNEKGIHSVYKNKTAKILLKVALMLYRKAFSY